MAEKSEIVDHKPHRESAGFQTVPPGIESLPADGYETVHERNNWCLFGCRCVQGAVTGAVVATEALIGLHVNWL